jgi:toxin CptA
MATPTGAAHRSRRSGAALNLAGSAADLKQRMSRESSSDLFLRLGASPQLTWVLGALHLGAIACGLANNLPLTAQGLLVVCVLLSAVHCIALHGTRRAPRAVVLLIWDGQGRWRLLQRDGTLLDVHLEHGAYVHPKLLILPFCGRLGRRRCVLVASDMVDADDLRRLRIRLRCEGPLDS